MNYKLKNQPFAKLKTMTCKRCGDDEDRVQGFCSNHCKDLREVEELREYKKNWEKLKDVLQLTIGYQDERDMHLLVEYIQILDEMNKLEGGEG